MTQQENGLIIVLHGQKKKDREIADIIMRSKTVVINFLKALNAYEKKGGSERPQKPSENTKRRLYGEAE